MRFVFKFSIALFMPLTLFAQNESYSYQTPFSNGKGDVRVELVDDISEAEAISEIKIESERAPSEVVISSDEDEILDAVSTIQNPNAVLVSVSDQQPLKNRRNYAKVVKKYAKNIVNSARNDKWTLAIVTYTTASDCLSWVHASNHNHMEISGNILFTIMSGIVFGLNQDAWSKTTRPIQKFFRKLVGLENQTLNRTDPKEIGIRFASSLTLATGLTVARLPFIPVDHIVEGNLNLNSWSLPFLMALISTAASFSWSEQIASVDQSENPTAKFALRRIANTRSFVLGTYATTAMMFNPEHYGFTPWVMAAASGALGLAIYHKSEAVVDFMESNHHLKNAVRRLSFDSGNGLSCADLFEY